MNYSIATVSMGGTLREKISAVAAAGYDGIELCENDVATFDGTAEDIRQLVESQGIRLVAFQPFRDFEGMPDAGRAHSFGKAHSKLQLAARLGAERLLICSSVNPDSSGDFDVIATDLRELGEFARGLRVEIAYEALSWGHHVKDYRDAWEIVRRTDHCNVKVVLDNWHIMALDLPLDHIRSIPKEKISFVQIADAPKMQMDLLNWSRHYRCFPGQGDWDVAAFFHELKEISYCGWVSHEIFNDRFRMGNPYLIACDGQRSFRFLAEATEGVKDDSGLSCTDGCAYIEFTVDSKTDSILHHTLKCLGFTVLTHDVNSQNTWWHQGETNLITKVANGNGNQQARVPSPLNVSGIGVIVSDPSDEYQRAQNLHAVLADGTPNSAQISITNNKVADQAKFSFFKPKELLDNTVTYATYPLLRSIDHISQTVEYEQFLSWKLFYKSIFGLEPQLPVDIADPAGLVESIALEAPNTSFRVCLNCSMSRNATLNKMANNAQYYCSIQHIAFRTDNIFVVAERLQEFGISTVDIPDNYYEELMARFGLDSSLIKRLKELSILYDQDKSGTYFQLYTGNIADCFFFEIVERNNYIGYGASNAPIRIAAQRRQSVECDHGSESFPTNDEIKERTTVKATIHSI